jgi:hypothetical protein
MMNFKKAGAFRYAMGECDGRNVDAFKKSCHGHDLPQVLRPYPRWQGLST